MVSKRSCRNILFVTVSTVILALIFLYIFGGYRPGNPGTIDIKSEYVLTIDEDIKINMPVAVHSIKTNYYLDGGTYSVAFTDLKGSNHTFCINRGMGEDKYYNHAYYGALHYTDGGIRIGHNVTIIKLMYSIMLEDQRYYDDFINRPRVVDFVYPNISHYCRGYFGLPQ